MNPTAERCKGQQKPCAALKEVCGPSMGNTAPVSSSHGTVLHTEKSDIMNRWVEHFSQLLNNTSTVNVAAIERADQCPIGDSLAVPPTLAELDKAIQLCSNGNSPGIDRIPAEIFKSGGKRIKKTSEMALLSYCTNALVTGMSAATIEESPYFQSLGSSMQRSW